MNIRETTRRLIIDELLMYGCVQDQMNVSDFVQRVYPKAMKMPTTDHRFGMTTAIEDIGQHMDNNNDCPEYRGTNCKIGMMRNYLY